MLPHHAPDTPAEPSPRSGKSLAPLLTGVVALAVLLLGIGLALRRGPFTQQPSTVTLPPATVRTLGKGRTFLDALLAHGIRPDLAPQIVQAFRPHVDFRRLKPEDSFEFHSDAGGAVTRVVYRQSPIDIVEARREGEAWTASRRDVPVEHKLSLVAGKVEGSLFESMETLGEQAQLVLDFAEIFAWDFDFASDSQPGDRFRMLVEKVFTGDQFVKYGRILVAEYESEGKTHTGIYFRDKDGGGYYTPAGESLRRAFLEARDSLLGQLRSALAARSGTPPKS